MSYFRNTEREKHKDWGLGRPRGAAPTGLSFPDVVHRFKAVTTKRYADRVKNGGSIRVSWPAVAAHYYEHIIRYDVTLERIREYILQKPLRQPFYRIARILSTVGQIRRFIA